MNIHRPNTRRVVTALVVTALAVWALVALVTGSTSEQRRRQETTPTTAATTAAAPAGTPDSAAPATESTATDEPATDEPATDEPATDEPEPDPDPDPEPDPDPQVPLGGNGDLAPHPTLPPPTCQQMECVAPVDFHPFEQPEGITPPGLDFAGAEAGGCSTECITRAQAFQSDGNVFDIEVETHTPAFIKIYIDDEEPSVEPDGDPYFPGKTPVAHTTGDMDQWFAATISDLDEETTYWVIVQATDEDVRSSYVVGTLVTENLFDDVEVVFAAIDIIYDGDHGRNKGELDFNWRVGLDEIGRNGTYKRGDGARIDLSGQINSWARVDLGDGELPLLQIRGQENDPQAVLEFCSSGGPWGYGTDDRCGEFWNSTLPMAFTIADIHEMAPCSVFELGNEYDEFVCTRLATVQSFGGIPEFSVVVAFRLF